MRFAVSIPPRTRRDAHHADLGYTLLTQRFIERRADERAYSLLADEVIVCLLLQPWNQLGPVSREGGRPAPHL
jgi:hypothetical protein